MYKKSISYPVALAATLFASYVLWGTPPTFASCGDIVYQRDYGEGPVEEREPIADCSNPFSVTDPVPFTYQLTLAGQTMSSGTALTIPEGEPVSGSVTIEKVGNFVFEPFQLFRQTGDDYTQVSPVTFTSPSDFTTTLTEGSYVAVLLYEEMPILTHTQPLWQRLLSQLFLPTTAYAFGSAWTQVVAIPFTVTYTAPTPTGASSVLFLPGIMGSRLYEEGEFCDALESENQLWFSVNDCLQQRLTTNFIGQSVESVYTKSGEGGILDEAFVFNVYKTFLGRLRDWKDADIINDYAAIPYDWRMELDKILKSTLDISSGRIVSGQAENVTKGYLYQTLANLAENSDSGKVTVVAHSNGGLVIKQFISDLKNSDDPLLDKIDNVILVAVPQIGTPNAIVGILHGESLDPVMSQVVTRRLMNTMPFAHHLLPTTGYFDSVDTPVVSFVGGEVTNPWIDSFGSAISSRDALHQFLSKDSGRVKPDRDDLNTPEVVDDFLLNYAKTNEIIQNNFIPMDNIKVYQIAGTGIETPSTLTYFTDRECVSRKLFICTEYRPKLGYIVRMTVDGDGTVVVPSALTLKTSSQVERRWLDLYEYNDDEVNREHKDILEVAEVNSFILDTIQSNLSSSSYEYLSNSSPTINEGNRLVFQLHSPLDMWLVTEDGKKVSSSTNDVDTATYRRYGELQYISIPRNENFTLVLDGQATGSFTLDAEELSDGELVKRHTYSGIPSDVGTKVTLEIGDSAMLDELLLVVDYDGDGVIDVSYNTEGEIANQATYDDLFAALSDLDLKRLPQLFLFKIAKSAERFHERSLKKGKFTRQEKLRLQLLLRQVKVYEHLRMISVSQSEELVVIITDLLN